MWNDDLDQVPTGLPLFVVAHEFIDALPVFKFGFVILLYSFTDDFSIPNLDGEKF